MEDLINTKVGQERNINKIALVKFYRLFIIVDVYRNMCIIE